MKKQSIFANEKDIDKLKAKSSQYYAKDKMIKNLYLTVKKVDSTNDNGISKIFIFKYFYLGKIYQISLGRYPEVSLSQARVSAINHNATLDDPNNKIKGIHPRVLLELKEEEHKRMIERNKIRTLEEVTLEWLSIQNRSFLVDKTKLGRINRHLLPHLGSKNIRVIDKEILLNVLSLFKVRVR